MANTFSELAKRADFSVANAPKESTQSPGGSDTVIEAGGSADGQGLQDDGAASSSSLRRITLGGLVYSIQIHLPESRDQAVYDALFRSLKTHLLE